MVARKKSSTHRAKAKPVVTEKKTIAKPPAAAAQPSSFVTIDRRESRDRRWGAERRSQNVPIAVERRAIERRVKVSRRRQIDPTTCERDYTPEEIEFMGAMDEYKRRNGRMFPTCSEILEVIKTLGYEKCLKVDAATLPTIETLPVTIAGSGPATMVDATMQGV